MCELLEPFLGNGNHDLALHAQLLFWKRDLERSRGSPLPERTRISDMIRIAGEADLILFHQSGTVVDAMFIPKAPLRGFDKIAEEQ